MNGSRAQRVEHKALNEQRRPGYSAIYDRIESEHPKWTHRAIAAAAKAEYHEPLKIAGDRGAAPRSVPAAQLLEEEKGPR
jgi:hypothetical protein